MAFVTLFRPVVGIASDLHGREGPYCTEYFRDTSGDRTLLSSFFVPDVQPVNGRPHYLHFSLHTSGGLFNAAGRSSVGRDLNSTGCSIWYDGGGQWRFGDREGNTFAVAPDNVDAVHTDRPQLIPSAT